MAAKEKKAGAEALDELRDKENWESLKDFSFGEYEGRTAKAGNRYGGYGETEWDEAGESEGSWLDADEQGAGASGAVGAGAAAEADEESLADSAKQSAGKKNRPALPHTSDEAVQTRAREVAEHDDSCAGLSQDEQSMLSAYSELYKSRDGRMTVFADDKGHVVCVQTKRLA